MENKTKINIMGGSMEEIIKAFDIVEKIGVKYTAKDYCNWISYVDTNDDIRIFDCFSSEIFCEDCIDKKIEDVKKQIKKGLVKIPNGFREITYEYDSISLEGEDFCICDECGEIIFQSIIWTCQEISHWLNLENKNWKKVKKSVRECYELMNILDPAYGAVEEFPTETLKIAEKVILFIK